MPSREEIAAALSEAAGSSISCQINFQLFHTLKRLAAQVDAMRCENCNHYFSASGGYYEKCYLKLLSEQGKGFGCFSWEAKEN